jgi:hypothetical protein
MDPLVALGLFVGIPVGLAAVIAIFVMVPRGKYGSSAEEEMAPGSALITSAPATPNPAALPTSETAGAGVTGGAHGNW